jgi:uncharacterized protein (DUF1800 family)
VVEEALAGLPLRAEPAARLVAIYREDVQRRQAAQRAAGESGRPPQPMRENGRQQLLQALGEMQAAKLMRAVLSERQLEEVLVDFWFNHFNVDVRQPLVLATAGEHEREAIRPHVFGSFRDLLGATARSPAMLVYLDNFRSTRAMEAPPRAGMTMGMARQDAPAAGPPRRGLNENYGRELLELHTLGVNGGYSQKDVQEVARAFTGWTIEPATGRFVFRERWHDAGTKEVLGRKIRGRGQRAGEQVLDLLAVHPSTARRLAGKLCQRFVADEPPAALVERVAEAFLASEGDLTLTYAALFLDPDFFAAEHRYAKTKSPFEFVASSLRATGATFMEPPANRARFSMRQIEATLALGRAGERAAGMPRKTCLMHLVEIGQPLYAWGPPTGFPEDSTSWVSAGALVARLNFALALTGGQVVDARVASPARLVEADADDPEAVINGLSLAVLGRAPAVATREVLGEQTADGAMGGRANVDGRKLLALLLGSPEFQRR